MVARDRTGREVPCFDAQGGAVRFLYGNPLGRVLLRLLIRPWVSRVVGWFLNRRVSALLIAPFVRRNHIDLTPYEGAPWRCYNAFFCRRIRPDQRPFDADSDRLTAPCDGKLTVARIDEDTHFTVKGTDYTMRTLLRNETLATSYRGGWLLLFRLTVDDYHRYSYPADGVVGASTRIPGVFHTVNPVAAAARPIYKENTREYATLHTDRFGDLLLMEVGAMMVGRIVNRPVVGEVHRGEERGHFEFGGSTVIVCVPPGRFAPDADLLKNSADGAETVVRMGESIGNADPYAADREALATAGVL